MSELLLSERIALVAKLLDEQEAIRIQKEVETASLKLWKIVALKLAESLPMEAKSIVDEIRGVLNTRNRSKGLTALQDSIIMDATSQFIGEAIENGL